MLAGIGGLIGGASISAALGADTSAYHNVEDSPATVYAGVSLGSSGQQYSISHIGGIGDEPISGAWMLSGSNTDFWVRATLNSGSLDYVNAGTGTFLALTSTRSWGLKSASGEDEASVTLEIATASGGSPIIATETYTLSAVQL